MVDGSVPMVQNPKLMPLIPYHVLAAEPTQPVPGIHSHRERKDLGARWKCHVRVTPILNQIRVSSKPFYTNMYQLYMVSKSAKPYALIPTFDIIIFWRPLLMIMTQNWLKTGVARVALSHCIAFAALVGGFVCGYMHWGWFRHVSVS